MDSSQVEHMLDAGDSPPQQPDFENVEPPPSTWPTVIGIISLIYAIIGLFCQGGWVVSTLMSETFMAMGGMQIEMPAVIKYATVGGAVLTSLCGLLLLVGAVKLLRRARSGPKWIKRWVVCRVLLVLLGVVSNFALTPANMQFQEDMIAEQNRLVTEAGRPDQVQVFDEEKQWRMQIIFLALFSAAALAYPVFVGFYLSRPKIAEEVSQWS